MSDIDKLDTTQLVVFWNKLDDHFDTGLLSDEDAEDINKTIQALIDRECTKARIEAFDVAFDCHDYDRLRAYRAELLKEVK